MDHETLDVACAGGGILVVGDCGLRAGQWAGQRLHALADGIVTAQQMGLLTGALRNRNLSGDERNALADLLGDAGASGDAGGSGDDSDQGDGDDQDPTTGMQIVTLSDGPALGAGMKEGDIILALGGQATTDLESLQDALQNSDGQTDVVFINVENGQTERMTLNIVGGRLGASVRQVTVE